MRTLDSDNVDKVDYERLEENLSQAQGQAPKQLEPIFKLAWSGFSDSSDPRGGPTVLAVLGGLDGQGQPGLSLFTLPQFNPPAPPASEANLTTLAPHFRDAMTKSVHPTRDSFYPTKASCQDFVLVPRETPHFSGTYDPYAILLLVRGPGDTTVVQAFKYPPPLPNVVLPPAPTGVDQGNTNTDILEDLNSTLQDMTLGGEPERISLPTFLNGGCHGPLDGTIIKLEKDSYTKLTSAPSSNSELLLKGGIAWSDESKLSDLKLSKVRITPNTHNVALTANN